MLKTFEGFGGTGPAIEPFMAAIEMIHTYSLIHDDLPCMDDDELRRGKPTNHMVFGEATALLAGDALLNFACETVASSDSCGAEMKLRAIKAIYNASGADGMIGGQVVDVESEGQAISKEKLEFIHHLKTSALIQSSMMIGAVLAIFAFQLRYTRLNEVLHIWRWQEYLFVFFSFTFKFF